MADSEKVVVELLAKVDGFDAKVKASAAGFNQATGSIATSATKVEGSLDKVAMSAKDLAAALKASGNDLSKIPSQMNAMATAATTADAALTKVGHSTGNTRIAQMELMHVVRGSADALAAGQAPMTVFATHLSMLAQAASFAGGEAGTFLGVLGNSWVTGVAVGAAVLLPMIANLIKGGESLDDMVDKLKKNFDETVKGDQAHAAYTHTLEGQIEIQKKLTEEIDKQTKSQHQLNQETLQAAINNSGLLRGHITEEQGNVQTAQEARDRADAAAKGSFGSPAAAVAASQAAVRAAADLKAAQDRLKSAQTAYQASLQSIRGAQIPIADEAIDNALDETAGKVASLKERIDTLHESYLKGTISLKAYTDQTAKLKKEIKDLEAAKTHHGNNAESGREVTSAEAKAIAQAAGFQVNSASRSYGDQKRLYDAWVAQGRPANNPVAMPGTSAHEGAKGRWALDIQLGPGVTPELLRKAFAAQGVNLTKVFKEQGHFHVEGSRSQADSAIDAEARAVEEEKKRRQTFVNELATQEGDELDARKALVASAEEIAKLETAAIEISRKRYDDNLAALVSEGKLTAPEAKQLQDINDERAKLRTELVQRREDQRKFRMQEATAQEKLQFNSDSYSVQDELLHSQEGIATTAKQRHDLEKRLLDLQFDEEKLQLEAIVAKSDRLKIELDRLATQRSLSDEEKTELQTSQDQAEIAQKRLDTLPARKANAETGNDRSNASPLQAFLQDGTKTADELNASLEGIAAGGLQSLTDGLADAIVNFRSLGDVARSVIQSLIGDLARLLIKMIAVKILKSILGLSGGGSVGGPSDGQGAAVPGLTVGGLANGGRVGYPTGGLITGPGTSTSDSISAITASGRPIRVSDGEYIIRGAAVRKLGLSTLNQINATGMLPVGFAGGGVLSMGPANASAAGGGGHATTVLSPDAVRQLESVVHRATKAMPDVKLFPTLDPARVLAAALSSPGGQRAFFDFVAANPRKFNTQLHSG